MVDEVQNNKYVDDDMMERPFHSDAKRPSCEFFESGASVGKIPRKCHENDAIVLKEEH